MSKIFIIVLTITFFFACSKEETNYIAPKPQNDDDLSKITLALTEDVLLFSHEDKPKTFVVQSNGKWEIGDLPQWLQATPMQGTDTTTVTLTVQLNVTNDARNVKLAVTAGAHTKLIDVWQEKEQKVETINVSAPGTLKRKLVDNNLGSATFLKVTGAINYSDLVDLRSLNRLLTLDLSDVSIVEGERYTGQKWVVSPSNCIDDTAFVRFTKIETLILPRTVNRIGKQAFAKCSSLQNVALQSSTRIIDDAAFADCLALQSIVVPVGVTEINQRAFAGCSSLQSISLPITLNVFSYEVFANCVALKSFALPTSLQTIEARAFANCTSLVYMHFGVRDGYIGDEAFYGCAQLQNITLPFSSELERNGKLVVGTRAFYNCTSLRQVNCVSNTPPIIGKSGDSNACFDTEYLEVCVLKVPLNAISNYRKDANWGSYNFRQITN